MPNYRKQSLTKLRENTHFDVVVVGGGINGIGVYRDLALQGLRVLLVERNDFCSGCSAAPSRMIHGGLRYLENGEFDLVRESLRERDALLQNAPHLVRPLPTMIPITSVFSGTFNAALSFWGAKGKPSNRGALPIKLGLSLYDWITRTRRVLPKHQFFGRAATRARWPALMPTAKRSAVYSDAWISHPERLGIELLKDTQQAAPSCIALNYAEFLPKGNGFALRDLTSGAELDVTARSLVNATGAWVDKTARGLGRKDNTPMVSGTKGSHLILDNPALLAALNGHMTYFEHTDGRVCIVFPYLGKVLAGSTDIRVDAPGPVRCAPEERDYILGALKLVFPGIEIAPSDVVFSYSGIRPLPQSDHDFTGRISRGHDTRRIEGNPPQFCMIGGKWTTFRAFAEQTADQVLSELGAARKQSTLDMPIGGGRGFKNPERAVQTIVDRFALPNDRATHLVGLYGSDAEQVAAFCAQIPNQDEPLVPGLPWSTREILWQIEAEYVVTLADLVLRRSSLAISGQATVPAIERIAALLAEAQGLSRGHITQQIQDLTDELTQFHDVALEGLVTDIQERREECV